MDKKVASNLSVGVFVAVAFAVFIFIVFSIGDGKGLFSSQMTFYGKFKEVKGLHQGSEVSLNGLRVGVVKTISVSAETKELVVTMSVDRKISDQLRQDTIAAVRTQGVLGDKYIELSIGSVGEALKDGVFIPTSEAPDLFSKSGNFVDEVSQHFSKGGNIDKMLLNLNLATQDLASITSGVKKEKSGEKLGRSIEHLESILAKIDNGEGTLGALVNDPSVYEDLKTMLGGAKRSSILRYFMKSFSENAAEDKKDPKKK